MSVNFVSEVAAKLPALHTAAASLLPFDDVICEWWIDTDDQCFGLGFDVGNFAYPSGSNQSYGARVYEDRVIMFCDTETPKMPPCREEYESDLPRLWSYLRQHPRPMHSFGTWRNE